MHRTIVTMVELGRELNVWPMVCRAWMVVVYLLSAVMPVLAGG